MIIRTPTTSDVVKIALLIAPDDVELQAQVVSQWLQQHTQPTFVSLAAVHKKQVVGYVAAHLTETGLEFDLFKAETPIILEMLWKKILQTYEFEVASLVTDNPDCFLALHFEPVYVTMHYQTKDVANDEPVREVSSGT